MDQATVTCPGCGTGSSTGKKFCAECGTALPLLCPSCGNAVTAQQKFCDECGTALQGARPAPAPAAEQNPASEMETRPAVRSIAPSAPPSGAPAEERRLVTALFCDLVGFTPLSEALDPEEVRDIQAAYFAAMSAQIERYGGTVEKYAGDAVLALFGAPIAHEDDAERAVLCALGMQAAIAPVAASAQARWDVEPAIRVGVNTGDVVSGTWDASGRQDVAVTGDALNTAARIQATAEPGEVLVGLETMRLTRRRIRYGERREMVLKGKVGTIPGYPALGIREQFGERWETSDEASPLVGRDRELLELLDAWIRAQGGEGQLVTLVGDAGVGKSRLITELLEKVGTSVAVRVIRARCLSYGQEISLWLLADLVRALFGISEQDALAEVRAKLAPGVLALLGDRDAETRAEALDVLGEVLGLPPGESPVTNAGPEIRRQALIRDLRLVLGALSERSPAIVVLEDLHWIDEASTEVLTEVLSDVPGLRLLVLTAQRPGWTAPWTDWGWTERLVLRPLRDEEATLLAGAVLGGMRLSPDLERYVADRAGGNPFFVEEMLRALRETGGLEQRDGQMYLVPGAAERLPSTLTEVLLARLDRLEGQVRSLAQVASVIGRSFAVRLLAQVVGREAAALDMPLTALQRAEIAFPRRGSDLEYVFKHVSMREVAYNTLVQKRRQELHLATARSIAALYPSDEFVEMIAYHYARTEEHAEAAEWLERAGDRAAATYANETAIDNFQEARRRRELVGGEQGSLARLDEKLGEVLLRIARYDEAVPLLERSVETYREVRDLEGAGRAAALLGTTLTRHGTPNEALVWVEPMVELLSRQGPSAGLASLHLSLSNIFHYLGRYEDMLIAAERAAEIARAIGDQRLEGRALERRGCALDFLGRGDAAVTALIEAIQVLERVGDLDRLRNAFTNLGEAHRMRGHLEEARQITERGLDTGKRIGDRTGITFDLANLGQIQVALGRWTEAQEHLEQAEELASAVASTSVTDPYIPASFGWLYLPMGKWDEAEEQLRRALGPSQASGDRQVLEYIHVALGELEVLRGRPEAAVAGLGPLAGREGGFRVLIETVLAWAHLDLDDVIRAEELATGAVQHARQQGELLSLADALRIQGMVLSRQERWEDAEQSFAEAIALARPMPYPYAEARAVHEYALMERRRGNEDATRAKLEEALTIFRRLGARKDIERAEAMLAAPETV